jgi:hypothetical protein
MLFAADFHKHFVQIEGVAITWMFSLQTTRKLWTEVVHPESNGFIAD